MTELIAEKETATEPTPTATTPTPNAPNPHRQDPGEAERKYIKPFSSLSNDCGEIMASALATTYAKPNPCSVVM